MKIKNCFILYFTFFVFTDCISQQIVIPLYDNLSTFNFPVNNAYYKDINNFQDQFVGTWLYVNGLNSIKLKFEKRPMLLVNSSPKQYYIDYLVGEIEYIENNVPKISNLDNLNVNGLTILDYSIFSRLQDKNVFGPICMICPPNSVGLNMYYTEPDNDDATLDGEMKVFHVVEQGVDLLKIKFYLASYASGLNKEDWESPSTKTNFTLPMGEYTFVKQ